MEIFILTNLFNIYDVRKNVHYFKIFIEDLLVPYTCVRKTYE
jgi:hypothetical protein